MEPIAPRIFAIGTVKDINYHPHINLPKWKKKIAKWLNIPVREEYLYEMVCTIKGNDDGNIRLNDYLMMYDMNMFVVVEIHSNSQIAIDLMEPTLYYYTPGLLFGCELIVYANTFSEHLKTNQSITNH